MSSCLHIRLDRGLRTLFLAALAAVAWLVLCTGTANAAPEESGSILNLDSVDAASDDPLVSGLPLFQALPTSPESITKPVTEVVTVAATAVVEAADVVLGSAQELIAGVDPLGAVVDPLAGELVNAVDAVVASVPALPLPADPISVSELPLPSVPLPLPVLQPMPDTGQVPQSVVDSGTAPQLTLNASGLFDAAAATAPPVTAASAAPYAPPTKQPAPAPFQQSGNQGLSPSGSSGSGGVTPPGAADIANPWPAPAPTHSGRIPVSAEQLAAAPSFDPGSRPD